MFASLLKDINNSQLISPGLKDLDLSNPVQNISTDEGYECTTIILNLMQKTRLAIRLPYRLSAQRSNNPEELMDRILGVVNTAHCLPKERRQALIADALNSFLLTRGAEKEVKIILPELSFSPAPDMNNQNSGSGASALIIAAVPAMPHSGGKTATAAEHRVIPLTIPDLPNLKTREERSRALMEKTLTSGQPKNLNHRRKRWWQIL